MIKILVLILLITSSFTFASTLKTRWTYEEDRALITQRLLNGTKTSEVKVEGKTPKQSCNRYNKLLIKYKSDLINYLDPSPTGVARTSPVLVETKKRKSSSLDSGSRKAQKAFFPEPATVADGSLRTEPVSQIIVVSNADCLDPNALLDTAQSNFVAPISQQPGNSQDSFIYPLGYFDGDDSLHTIPPSPFGMSPQSAFSSPVRGFNRLPSIEQPFL
jgi:hypothetical protein